jgi:HD domain
VVLHGSENNEHKRNRSIPQATGDFRKDTTLLNLSSQLVIPDSLLAKEATNLLREHSTDLLINHSMRVYFFSAEQGRQQRLRFDPELLYVASAFHDFGLIKKFSSPDERFEVDGANAVRQFLTTHNVPEERVQLAWEAVALHTTPGITSYMRPEVNLLYSGVGLDVLGRGLDSFPSELRERIVAEYPRKHFKEGFIKEYFAGFAHKPGTTYGTVNASICDRLIPGYKAPNACDVIASSPFPDSE